MGESVALMTGRSSSASTKKPNSFSGFAIALALAPRVCFCNSPPRLLPPLAPLKNCFCSSAI